MSSDDTWKIVYSMPGRTVYLQEDKLLSDGKVHPCKLINIHSEQKGPMGSVFELTLTWLVMDIRPDYVYTERVTVNE
jgi:hypothetical protein